MRITAKHIQGMISRLASHGIAVSTISQGGIGTGIYNADGSSHISPCGLTRHEAYLWLAGMVAGLEWEANGHGKRANG
jgi:hypothetical protein